MDRTNAIFQQFSEKACGGLKYRCGLDSARGWWIAALSATFCGVSPDFSAISSALFSSSFVVSSAASNTPSSNSTICCAWCAVLGSRLPERPSGKRHRQQAIGTERSGYVSSQFTPDEACTAFYLPLHRRAYMTWCLPTQGKPSPGYLTACPPTSTRFPLIRLRAPAPDRTADERN